MDGAASGADPWATCTSTIFGSAACSETTPKRTSSLYVHRVTYSSIANQYAHGEVANISLELEKGGKADSNE